MRKKSVMNVSCGYLLLLACGVAAGADVSPPAASGPPITLASLEGTGGLSFATWLLAGTFQHVTGRSSKIVALVAALGLSVLVQILTDASPIAQVILLAVLNGCQAYLAAAGVASVAGAVTAPVARAASMTVQPRRRFFGGWF